MKTFKLSLLILIISTLTLMISCKKHNAVNVENFEMSLPENPIKGLILGKIEASSHRSYLTFALLSESVKGALKVDQLTGELFVKDKTKFNYETNPVITAEVLVTNGKYDAIANVTITLIDVFEQPAVIGEYRDFGVVFWIDPTDNSRGLICATYDQGGDDNWSCMESDVIGATASAIGTGDQNTLAILDACTDNFTGAYDCSHYSDGGFTDWYLPSKDELKEMYNQKNSINSTSISKGGLALKNVYYWSSTQESVENGYTLDFGTGTVISYPKQYPCNVRAVRKFGMW